MTHGHSEVNLRLTEDEAGPFKTVPVAGNSWEEDGRARKPPHEYRRDGTAKMLTLFHPASGEVRARGVKSCTNVGKASATVRDFENQCGQNEA
jgi:hypothetical protein